MTLLSRLLGRRSAAEPEAVRVEPAAPSPPAARRPRLPGRAAARKFMAARPDRLVGGFSGLGLHQSQRMEVRQDLRGLVAHARHAARNLDYVRGYERLVMRNVIGPRGVRLRAQGKRLDGALDQEANARVEAAWSRWGKRGNATTCGRLSWWNVERIAAVALAREGNFLARIRTGPKFGPFAFQLQVLPLDVVDLDLVQTLKGGRYIDGGIEFDAGDRPVAVHMWDVHPGEYHVGRRPSRVRVPVGDLIHLYDPTEPMQALGVPASHTALRRLNMVGRYEEAALTAAHFGAATMAWLKSDPEADDMLPEEVEAGLVARLPPGTDLASWSPSYPDGELPAFTKHMIRGGAAGLGVAYSSLANDLEGANFSSLRAGLGEEREEWRMWQRVIAEGLHGPVFARWLPVAILSGELELPMVDVPGQVQAAEWQPRGWASVNPKDDAAAAEADLRNRLRAPSDILAERGQDFGDTVRRIAEDMATLEAAGIPLPQSMAAQAPGSPAAPAPAGGDPEGDPPDGEDGPEGRT